jgi:MFS family permease
MKSPDKAKIALTFVVIIGIANGFADLTYESGRSLNGEFLAGLGASAAVVGFTAGFGELIGYGFRSVMGLVADRTHRYWTLAILGYVINMLAVPALALVGNWPLAAVLIVLERTGRAIRKPSTETMLSFAGSQIGHGWVFGLNEALDQTGATIGPLMMSLALWLKSGFQLAYGLLLIPACLTILAVLVAHRVLKEPHSIQAERDLAARNVTQAYWWYVAAASCVAAGFADFALIGFHLAHAHILPSNLIPIYYAVAMGVGAVGGLGLGRLFDRWGLTIVVVAFLVSAGFAPLVFFGGSALALLGMVLWGVGLAAQDSLLKPLIAGLVSSKRRASAFGVFDTGFGIAWFVGSAVMGLLYAHSIVGLVVFSVLMQLVSLPIFVRARALSRVDDRPTDKQ